MSHPLRSARHSTGRTMSGPPQRPVGPHGHPVPRRVWWWPTALPNGDGALGGSLSVLDVLRADERESGLLSGTEVSDGRRAVATAQALQARGPRLVIFAVGSDGNAAAWAEGPALIPFGEQEDRMSWSPGMTSGSLSGCDPPMAALSGWQPPRW